MTLAELPMTRSGTARPHSSLHELFDLFSNNFCELRSPVTESNRRPSPYHACRFRLPSSGWVGLPQARRILVSEYVELGLPLPGIVVTWFVTGYRICPEKGDRLILGRSAAHRRRPGARISTQYESQRTAALRAPCPLSDERSR